MQAIRRFGGEFAAPPSAKLVESSPVFAEKFDCLARPRARLPAPKVGETGDAAASELRLAQSNKHSRHCAESLGARRFARRGGRMRAAPARGAKARGQAFETGAMALRSAPKRER